MKETEHKLKGLKKIFTHLKFGWSLGFFRLEVLTSEILICYCKVER